MEIWAGGTVCGPEGQEMGFSPRPHCFAQDFPGKYLHPLSHTEHIGWKLQFF